MCRLYRFTTKPLSKIKNCLLSNPKCRSTEALRGGLSLNNFRKDKTRLMISHENSVGQWRCKSRRSTDFQTFPRTTQNTKLPSLCKILLQYCNFNTNFLNTCQKLNYHLQMTFQNVLSGLILFFFIRDFLISIIMNLYQISVSIFTQYASFCKVKWLLQQASVEMKCLITSQALCCSQIFFI